MHLVVIANNMLLATKCVETAQELQVSHCSHALLTSWYRGKKPQNS